MHSLAQTNFLSNLFSPLTESFLQLQLEQQQQLRIVDRIIVIREDYILQIRRSCFYAGSDAHLGL